MRHPYLIPGGIFTDHRGAIHHINDFRVEDFCRCYMIGHADTVTLRAWQGHLAETKAFYVVKGSFAVNAVHPGDFDNPDPLARVFAYRLSESVSQVLIIPEGYANGMKALEPGSRMMLFSNMKLADSDHDIIRYPAHFWTFDDAPGILTP